MFTKRPTIDPKKGQLRMAPQDLGALSGNAIGGKEENPNNAEKRKPRTEEFFSKQKRKPKKSKRK
jgi:hypothetical protein